VENLPLIRLDHRRSADLKNRDADTGDGSSKGGV